LRFRVVASIAAAEPKRSFRMTSNAGRDYRSLTKPTVSGTLRDSWLTAPLDDESQQSPAAERNIAKA